MKFQEMIDWIQFNWKRCDGGWNGKRTPDSELSPLSASLSPSLLGRKTKAEGDAHMLTPHCYAFSSFATLAEFGQAEGGYKRIRETWEPNHRNHLGPLPRLSPSLTLLTPAQHFSASPAKPHVAFVSWRVGLLRVRVGVWRLSLYNERSKCPDHGC